MRYITPMKYKQAPAQATNISNVEFMLLQIVSQAGEISGYSINKLVEERQYRVWAGIGTTSIYTGLERLKRKGLVTSRVDMSKRGKGPLPRKSCLTRRGRAVLRKEIEDALSRTRERDLRFDLAIAAIPLISAEATIRALQKRKRFLGEVAAGIRARFEAIGGENLPVNIRAPFKHSLHLIKRELEFVDVLIGDVRQTKKKKELAG